MIASVSLAGLRGVKKGTLSELAPLTILVGPNGCGKSTVLDALLLSVSSSPGDAVGRVVRRRHELTRAARWLTWRAEGAALIGATDDAGQTRTLMLDFYDNVPPEEIPLALHQRPPPFTAFSSSLGIGERRVWATTIFATDNAYAFSQRAEPRVENYEHLDDRTKAAVDSMNREAAAEALKALRAGPDVRMIEPRPGATHASFQKIYTEAVESGRRDEVLAAARSVIPDLQNIEILTPEDVPVVELVFKDHALPLAAAGDGIKTLLRLVMELSIRPGGLALIEEPEVHQHPGSLRESAKALLLTLRRNVQIVVSTHSLELIDAIIAQATPADLSRIAVFRLRLEDGELRSSRAAGPDVQFERTEIDEDLR